MSKRLTDEYEGRIKVLKVDVDRRTRNQVQILELISY